MAQNSDRKTTIRAAEDSDLAVLNKVEASSKELLDDAIVALDGFGYNATAGGAEALLVKVGINAAEFCTFVKAHGLAAENCSIESAGDTANNTDWGIVRLPVIKNREDLRKLKEAVSLFGPSYIISFDLDGTLVDTTESFDTTVSQLVERHTGKPLTSKELKDLRAEGGFNNNWDAAVELIRRRGKTLTRKELDPEALEIYFSLAKEKEKQLVDLSVLDKLAKRHPLYILTGRCQFEYQPVWESRLGKNFKRVYCLDDLPQCKPKPAPDSLIEIMKKHDAVAGVYVGNAFDDMWAARSAKMQAIAVTTTHSAQELKDAGAQITYDHPDQVLEAFLLGESNSNHE